MFGFDIWRQINLVSLSDWLLVGGRRCRAVDEVARAFTGRRQMVWVWVANPEVIVDAKKLLLW